MRRRFNKRSESRQRILEITPRLLYNAHVEGMGTDKPMAKTGIIEDVSDLIAISKILHPLQPFLQQNIFQLLNRSAPRAANNGFKSSSHYDKLGHHERSQFPEKGSGPRDDERSSIAARLQLGEAVVRVCGESLSFLFLPSMRPTTCQILT